jgi:hypothetical protein
MKCQIRGPVFALLESQLVDSATGQLTEACKSTHAYSVNAKDLQVRDEGIQAPDISTTASETASTGFHLNKIAFDTLSLHY